MYSELKALENYIDDLGRYQKVLMGTDFIVNNNSLPLCLLIPDDGEIIDYTLGNYEQHIICLFHDNRELEKTKLEDMETMISDLEQYDDLRLINPRFSFDGSALSVFGIDIPVMAPYGAYRFSYDIGF